MSLTITGIIFDKDGTLFDYRTTWEAWAAAVLRKLAGGDEARASALAQRVDYDLAAGRFAPHSIVIAGTPVQIAEALAPGVPEMSTSALFDVLNEEATHAPQAEATPLQPLLHDLRARSLALGVATNDAEIVAHAQLRRAGITDFFTFVAGADSGFGGKPAPGQLHAFAEATGLAPHEIAMIGDSTHDLFAARAAGMVAVGVLTGPAGHAQLAPHADHVIASIAELPDLLR